MSRTEHPGVASRERRHRLWGGDNEYVSFFVRNREALFYNGNTGDSFIRYASERLLNEPGAGRTRDIAIADMCRLAGEGPVMFEFGQTVIQAVCRHNRRFTMEPLKLCLRSVL